MHELSICEGIVQLLQEQAAHQHFSQVKTVWLEIGQLAGIEPEALLFSFDAAAKGTLAEGAKLKIIEVPGRAWCLFCAKPVAVSQRYDACPECGSYQLQVTGGEELRVKELEVN